jgi:hypothetical protein
MKPNINSVEGHSSVRHDRLPMDSELGVGSLLPAKFVAMVGVTNFYLIEKFQ